MSEYSNLKQVIVMRTDLNMRKGKMAVQLGHASQGWVHSRMSIAGSFDGQGNVGIITVNGPLLEWLTNERSAKICLAAESEEHLLSIAQRAQDAGIFCYVVTDAGLTEFHGVPTKTCLALGPDEASKIDAITGDLKLL
jgi:PTH2 family peptidyl-tRNA hydrolase